MGHRQILLAEPQDRVFFRIDLFVPVFEIDANTGVDQEDSKNVKQPVKLFDHHCTDEDKNTAEHNRTQDPPKQDLVIIRLVNLEVLQDKQDDKDIVDR